MLSQDVIEPSDSAWNFPHLLVPKPDGTMRPVIDNGKLNEQIIPDRLPLPVISDILRSLRTTNKLFSTTDITSAFWQIDLDEASRPLTTFSTPSLHYHFRKIPFGLSNSPLTYMQLMNNILHGLIGNTASIFLDDIFIVSETEAEHFHNLNQVVSRLVVAGYKNVVSYKRKLYAHDLNSSEFSPIWLRLHCHSIPKYICAVYLSPNSTNYV